jgi:hypothetical protein
MNSSDNMSLNAYKLINQHHADSHSGGLLHQFPQNVLMDVADIY